MAKGSIKVGDEVAITATVRKRVTEDRVSVLIPSYSQPHSIVDTTPNISSGQKIDLIGEVLRVDEDTVTLGGKDLGITVNAVPCDSSPAMLRRSGRSLWSIRLPNSSARCLSFRNQRWPFLGRDRACALWREEARPSVSLVGFELRMRNDRPMERHQTLAHVVTIIW